MLYLRLSCAANFQFMYGSSVWYYQSEWLQVYVSMVAYTFSFGMLVSVRHAWQDDDAPVKW